MNKQEFTPVKKWHNTNTHVGTGDIKPLPTTKLNDGSINSVWTLPSKWERFKFLFFGEITLRMMGSQPPVAIVAGDIFGRKP
jgi:hypothetical protein